MAGVATVAVFWMVLAVVFWLRGRRVRRELAETQAALAATSRRLKGTQRTLRDTQRELDRERRRR